jgi:prepilin-type N-terminal cleavage/methylation domain-containing protein
MTQGSIRKPCRRGFTLVELMISMLASSILLLAVVNVLASNQKQYNRTYDRVYGDVVRNAQEARAIFDVVVRGSTIRKVLIGSVNEYAEVYYYRTWTSLALDGYARFYTSNGELKLERGQLEPGTFTYALSNSPTTQVVARHVTSCTFSQEGVCVAMAMVLNDGKVDLPTVATATRHNE